METLKVSYSSSTHRFGVGEERLSLLMTAQYLGFGRMLKIVHHFRDGDFGNREQVHFIFGMIGVEGYPVNCFIDWMEKFYGISLKWAMDEKKEEDGVVYVEVNGEWVEDDGMWIDPAGGVHYGDDDDPAAMYE